MLLLRTHVERCQLDNDVPLDTIMDEFDWRNLEIYVASLQTLSDASDLLEGESYNTASSVIPFLDQVRKVLISSALTVFCRCSPVWKVWWRSCHSETKPSQRSCWRT